MRDGILLQKSVRALDTGEAKVEECYAHVLEHQWRGSNTSLGSRMREHHQSIQVLTCVYCHSI